MRLQAAIEKPKPFNLQMLESFQTVQEPDRNAARFRCRPSLRVFDFILRLFALVRTYSRAAIFRQGRILLSANFGQFCRCPLNIHGRRCGGLLASLKSKGAEVFV
jgi:hypothetical protein